MSIPPSDNTVRVKLIDTTTYLTGIAQIFVDPVVKGHETLSFYDVAFLIEHDGLGKKAMFDLGTRKDYWNLAPGIQAVFGSDTAMTGMRIDKEVSEILVEGGVTLDSVDYCIWSHFHYDHCGNMSPFPPSTSIVIGSGAKAAGILPGYPENPKSPVLASDFANRNIEFVEFSGSLTIGGFPAHDFFGDGSFYLLDTPGHCQGHICALARTTSSSSTGGASFMLLGGDISHFPGHFRPSPSLSLPDPIPASALVHRANRQRLPPICPCSLFAGHHPKASSDQNNAPKTPWYDLPGKWPTAYEAPETARSSVLKLQELDGDENILVCLAHDSTLLEVLPVFSQEPRKDCNNWKAHGWKQQCHWGWLNEISMGEQTARPLIVDGFWRDGKKWDYDAFKKELFASQMTT